MISVTYICQNIFSVFITNGSFSPFFEGFSDFGVNFRCPNSLQLTPPWSEGSSGTSKRIFRPLGLRGSEHTGWSYRAKREIFENLNFRLRFLRPSVRPIDFPGIMWYTHLDLRLGLGIFELSPRRKMLGLRRPKSGVGYISPEPQDSSKIQKTGHFGAKILPKTHSKHISRV